MSFDNVYIGEVIKDKKKKKYFNASQILSSH